MYGNRAIAVAKNQSCLTLRTRLKFCGLLLGELGINYRACINSGGKTGALCKRRPWVY